MAKSAGAGPTARHSALEADSAISLLGVEGAATCNYFAGLALSLGPEWEFTSRQRRPTLDAVNAMLSFAYALLKNRVSLVAKVSSVRGRSGS